MSTKSNAELKFELSCPAPLAAKDTILLGHGSGGKLSAELIRDIFLPAFQNPILARLDDQAIVNVNGQRLAITTDSFVVKPLFFPGGDIGSLAVHGTVNDLAMGGAMPLFLSAAFIIEEGFSMDATPARGRIRCSGRQRKRACRWLLAIPRSSRKVRATGCSSTPQELDLCPKESNFPPTAPVPGTRCC